MARRVLVDGLNVIGCRPDGWWRDRDAAKRSLAEQLAAVAASGAEVTVVYDGRPPAKPIDAPGVKMHHAFGGPGGADNRIVELLEADLDPSGVEVVTSDGELARRVRKLGAKQTGAGAFRRELDAL